MIKKLQSTLKTPTENLACDEALLDYLDRRNPTGGMIRFWESNLPFVVLGYSRPAEQDVWVPPCQEDGVPILRRISGGGTVLQGPGCLNYSLFIPIKNKAFGPLITDANHFIMRRHAQALSLVTQKPVRVQGHTDLTLENLKFSGNAQRRKEHFLLFHGTFLLSFDLPGLGRYLKAPPIQPQYRQNREHEKFLTNLHLKADLIEQSLCQTWEADQTIALKLDQEIQALIEEKYSQDSWNFKF